MGANRRQFLQFSAGALAQRPASGMAARQAPLDGYEIASRHRFRRTLPTPDFFQGMLLGNGDAGVCVTVRPDAFGIHLGKLDAWDIRVTEDHFQHVLPMSELLALWQRASDEAKRLGQPDMLHLETGIPFFAEYTRKVGASYAKPWPRPWPCGIVWVHWDARRVTVLEQQLNPANALYEALLAEDDLKGGRRQLRLRCFVNWEVNHVCVWTDEAAPFVSVAYYPQVDQSTGLPRPELDGEAVEDGNEFRCFQRLPSTAPTEAQPFPPPHSDDSNFQLVGRVRGAWQLEEVSGAAGRNQPASAPPGGNPRVFLRSARPQPLRLDVVLLTPRDHPHHREEARREVVRLSRAAAPALHAKTEAVWKGYWRRAAVSFENQRLERIWYHNQYFLACSLREGKVAPGLFGNWSSGNIGTAWHGDYHMNYNTQQVWWGVFSSNRVDLHLPFVDLVEKLLPIAEHDARVRMEMPGAFFPHSAYPVPSQVNPYPVPPWGYEVCETPWTVQSLWWHYQYTLDKQYLERIYPLMRAACRFLAAYVRRGEDGKYHIAPTVSPENWGFTVDHRLNQDCIIDLALSEFVLRATAEAAALLQLDPEERLKWEEIGVNLAPYPTVNGPYGEVWLDVPGAPAEYVYNCAVTLSPVFPAEQVGLGRREDQLEIARRTTATVRLEGGNDLVWQPLVRARLGMLDLAWFQREVDYCTLENGVSNDRVRQIGGRYRDSTNFDFMMRMGIWTENFSLPAVLNECMMQSYTGVIRLFPNTQNLGPARFASLRAVGAFLVSAAWNGREVLAPVEIHSEKGGEARLLAPWTKPLRVRRQRGGAVAPSKIEDGILRFPTEAGGTYLIAPA